MTDTPVLIKALGCGDSGNGKTGSLASLAKAGYSVNIIDFDNKMGSANILRSELEDDPKAWGRVRYKTLSDKTKFFNGKPTLVTPCTAYRGFGTTLAEWGADKFTSDDVLAVDTLSSMSDAAFNEACAMTQRLSRAPDGSDRPRLQEFGWMADSVKLAMDMICSDEMPCHVIVFAHIKILAPEEEEMTMKTNKAGQNEDPYTRALGLPNARGQEIPRVVARYFNNVFYYTRQGPNRVISTQPSAIVDTKTSKIKGISRSYPVADGLAKLFADLGAERPSQTPKESQGAQASRVVGANQSP